MKCVFNEYKNLHFRHLMINVDTKIILRVRLGVKNQVRKCYPFCPVIFQFNRLKYTKTISKTRNFHSI